MCVVVWVDVVRRQRRRRSNNGRTSFEISEVGWDISEPPIPQRLYGSVCKLRNGQFRNMFGHLPMCCGTTHSATCIASVYKLRNRWFRNTLGGVQMYCGTAHSATCIRIHIDVAEWMVPQQKQFENTLSPNCRSHEISPNTLQIL